MWGRLGSLKDHWYQILNSCLMLWAECEVSKDYRENEGWSPAPFWKTLENGKYVRQRDENKQTNK